MPPPHQYQRKGSIKQRLGNILRTNSSISLRIQPTSSEKPSRSSSFSEKYPSWSDNSKGDAGNALVLALRALHNNANGFPPLRDAIQQIMCCLNTLETTADESQEYNSFSTEIWALDEIIQRLKDPVSDQVSGCAVHFALSIRHLAKTLDTSSSGNVLNREQVNASLVPIMHLFRKLKIEIELGIQNIANDDIRLEQLSPVKPASYDAEFPGRRLCARGTCTQTLSGLADWGAGADGANVYWMTGSPGTGKTTIATTFSHQIDEEKRLAASFFCHRASLECRQVNRILPTIVYQLARYSMIFRSALSRVLRKDPAIGSKDITSQFLWLLKNPLIEVGEVLPNNLIIVLDAPDECDDESEVKRLFNLLIHESRGFPVKFFITTRPAAIIHCRGTELATGTAPYLHQLEALLTRGDIKLYLDEELSDGSLTIREIEHLIHQSGNLFVYAATLVRLIRNFLRSLSLQNLLQALPAVTPESTSKHNHVDELYKAVLRLALEQAKDRPAGTRNIRLVLMVVLCARELLDVDTIAGLTGIWDREVVLYTLQQLKSLLSTSDKNGLVSVIDTCFSEFMIDKARSGAFFCDPAEYNQIITQQCFETMERQLRFNICKLDSSRTADTLVRDLPKRIQAAISNALSYSCRYWGYHLHLSPWSTCLEAALNEFLCTRLLFWMEVMNLKRLMGAGSDILLRAQKWIKEAISPDLELSIDDAHKFVERFATTPASQSTPHIYISALLFWPHSNFVSKCYRERIHGLAKPGGRESVDIAAVATWQADSRAGSIAFSPNETRVALGCESGMVEVRDIYNRSLLTGPIIEGHSNKATSPAIQHHSNSTSPVDAICPVALSTGGNFVASSSSHHTIQIRALNGGSAPINIFEGQDDCVLCVAFSPDGQLIASGLKNCSVRVWSSQSGARISGRFTGHSASVNSVIFSPGGRRLASASSDKTIRVWDPYNGTLIAGPFVGHSCPINTVSFSPNGAYLVSGSADGTIGIWDSRNGLAMIGTGVGTFLGHTGPVCSVIFSSNSNYIISGSEDQTVRIWDAASGQLANNPFYVLTEPIVSLSVSPSGNYIASSSKDSTVQLWRFSATVNSMVIGKPGHPMKKTDKSFSEYWKLRPDGWVVTEDSSLLLWILPGVHSSLFAPGSDRICTLIGCTGTYEVNLSDLPLGGRWCNCYGQNWGSH